MTPSQMRAMRAKQLLDSGKEPADVARELGYTKVSGMLGAIALCSRKIERDEKKILQMIAEEPPKVVSKVVTEDGVRAELVFPKDRTLVDFLKEGHADPAGEPGEPGEPGCATPDGYRANVVIADEMPSASRLREAEFKPAAKIYRVENGIVTIGKELCSVTYKPDVRTAFINLKPYRKWLPLYGNLLGGREGMSAALRQIAEAATEAAALIEEGAYVDHYA